MIEVHPARGSPLSRTYVIAAAAAVAEGSGPLVYKAVADPKRRVLLAGEEAQRAVFRPVEIPPGKVLLVLLVEPEDAALLKVPGYEAAAAPPADPDEDSRDGRLSFTKPTSTRETGPSVEPESLRT